MRGSIAWIAQRQRLAIALVGLLAFAGCAVVTLLTGVPEPCVTDEFSYMFAAETFAHGRLSNPPHPLWVHFETFHILQQPTYASKYPPAQGMILAVGQIISGHPIVGVWLSVGLLGAAMCWMLLAWLPPHWAVFGGLLASMQTGILGYWGQSYWGGAVAATGGALVFGALRRIISKPRVYDAVLMGVGLAILANSRPYEGLVASLPAAAVLLVWALDKNSPPTQILIKSLFLPVLVVLTLTGGFMGFYNLRVIGEVFHLPYQVYEATYSPSPSFVWQSRRPHIVHRNAVMREAYNNQYKDYLQRKSLRGFVKDTTHKLSRLWRFYLGPALTIPLLMLPWILRDKWMRFALLTCSIEIAAVLLGLWGFPHYTAPVTGLIYVPVLQGMRHLYVWQWQGKPGRQLVLWAIFAVYLASWVTGLGVYKSRSGRSLALCPDRAPILAQLNQDAGRHLILVRYGPQHPPDHEWVYNAADIDGAQVVWARELDALQNRELLAYFSDRKAWLLQVDADGSPPQFTPYPVDASSAPSAQGAE